MSHLKGNAGRRLKLSDAVMNNHEGGDASAKSPAEEEDESTEFLRSLAKMHADQFFQQIISATGELKASRHLAEATLKEITERFTSSLSCQVK